ncbi:DUF1064 domain-containing protein [Cytobacillus solani]|nr:DUF1064 domain-containing protein [Cytobacillus solani]
MFFIWERRYIIQSTPKYGNKKTMVDGITYDSRAEAIYYNQLKWKKHAKQIKDFKLQPRYLLQDSFKKNGKTYRKIEYIADFEVTNLDGSTQIIDKKGVITKEFAIKQKLFELKYMDSITLLKYKNVQFVEVYLRSITNYSNISASLRLIRTQQHIFSSQEEVRTAYTGFRHGRFSMLQLKRLV